VSARVRATARPRPTARRPAASRRASAAPSAGSRSGRPTPRDLIREADRARRRAYAPYSDFPVGAALLTRQGRVIHGCNVENASYGLCVCAERTALWKALIEGESEFTAIAVTARQGHGAPPCGACRQVLFEFAPRLWVYWRDGRGRILRRRLVELLAMPFVLRTRRRA